jgi:hypothetical protein
VFSRFTLVTQTCHIGIANRTLMYCRPHVDGNGSDRSSDVQKTIHAERHWGFSDMMILLHGRGYPAQYSSHRSAHDLVLFIDRSITTGSNVQPTGNFRSGIDWLRKTTGPMPLHVPAGCAIGLRTLDLRVPYTCFDLAFPAEKIRTSYQLYRGQHG